MLRALTISHDSTEPADQPSPKLAMEKDAALVTMDIPDYHDGLRDKPSNAEYTADSSSHSDKRAFQVRLSFTDKDGSSDFNCSATSISLPSTILVSHYKLHGKLLVSHSSLHGPMAGLLLLSMGL